ncbi:uncharacterized protein MKK02DRAFT_39886 [Dioszegia hungarica]|uniref:Uncharacterized protein n=1 Tax=Dioszegia hungarica TaxID=4972 RepID=A0AA38LXD1_9TREE|nr:uncharacterized protein MKK02DRAFT_39886 [Dioszegia hungarica]KAI9639570.1 hypothetical protein MKK02DRAFT_39886 [Dioszegia hungarica]
MSTFPRPPPRPADTDEPSPDIPLLSATPEQLFIRLKELVALAKVVRAEGPPNAARRAYDLLEVRERIIFLLDRRTQARMMRVHKAGTACVASVLYRHVHINVMKGMSQIIPRRAVCCLAVRSLDISPRPDAVDPFGRLAAFERRAGEHARAIGLAHIQENLQSWRKKPQFWQSPFEPPVFPPTPQLTGATIRKHTIIIRLANRGRGFEDEYHPEPSAVHSRQWTEYLFLNPALDRRVSGIDLNEAPWLNPPYEGLLAFTSSRMTDTVSSLVECTVSDKAAMSIEAFRALPATLAPHLRVLQLSIANFARFPEVQTGIIILDVSLPFLDEFTIDCARAVDVQESRLTGAQAPLAGMNGLRRFNILYHLVVPLQSLAEHICRLGSNEVVFHFGGIKSKEGKRDFHKLAQEHVLSARGIPLGKVIAGIRWIVIPEQAQGAKIMSESQVGIPGAGEWRGW